MAELKRREFVKSAGLAAAGALAGAGIKPVFAEDAGSTDAHEGLFANVREFGAKGDGKTDDTEAIKAAVKAAFDERGIHLKPHYGYYITLAEVFLPTGVYRISDTIDINAVNLRGEGHAVIEQADPEKDIFFTPWAHRVLIEGLSFCGGNVQLNLGNDNLGDSVVHINDCVFYWSGAAAVQMRKGSNSSFFQVTRSKFIDCKQALINHCDMCTISECWISTSKKMKDEAVLENYGVMHIEDVIGVPRANGTDQRWIDNHGVLRASRVRFGGEDAGFTPVVNFVKAFKWPSSVTLDQCYIYSLGNSKRKCAVYLEEIPNTVRITDCTGFMGQTELIQLSPDIDIGAFKEQAEKSPEYFHFTFWGNSYPGGELPEALLAYANLTQNEKMKRKMGRNT